MYKKDLSKNGNKIYVGWLDDNHDYTKGSVPKGFLEKLKKQKIVNNTKGSHRCPFCGKYSGNFGRDWSSSAEYKIKTTDGYFYSPTMIYHYVRDHNYKPPEEFIDAVMNNNIKVNKIKNKRRFVHIKKFINFMNESEGGGDGGGISNATLSNTGGMGDVVAPTVGDTPGKVWGNGSGNIGSGDIPAYNMGKKFDIIKSKKKKKKKKKKIKRFDNFK